MAEHPEDYRYQSVCDIAVDAVEVGSSVIGENVLIAAGKEVTGVRL